MVGTIAVAPTIPNPNIIVRISNADSLKAWIIPKLDILEEGFQMVRILNGRDYLKSGTIKMAASLDHILYKQTKIFIYKIV